MAAVYGADCGLVVRREAGSTAGQREVEGGLRSEVQHLGPSVHRRGQGPSGALESHDRDLQPRMQIQLAKKRKSLQRVRHRLPHELRRLEQELDFDRLKRKHDPSAFCPVKHTCTQQRSHVAMDGLDVTVDPSRSLAD